MTFTMSENYLLVDASLVDVTADSRSRHLRVKINQYIVQNISLSIFRGYLRVSEYYQLYLK